MGRHDHLLKFEALEVAVVLVAVWMNATRTYSQPGFLSIDCGSSQAPYNDDINLTWVSDGEYILTGETGRYSTPYSSGVGNDRALQDFRYFPEPRDKYCFELPTISNISYLLRAMFFFNYSEVLELPIQFTASINATDWFTMDYPIPEDGKEPLFDSVEAIFYSLGNVTYFCLQPVTGVPFISSLELRPLDSDSIMYSFTGDKLQLIASLFRYNLGVEASAPTVRYPDDICDRLWLSPPAKYANSLPSIHLPMAPDQEDRPAVNSVPPKVMKDAWIHNNNSGKVFTLIIPSIFPEGASSRAILVYAPIVLSIVYAEDLSGQSSRSWDMDVAFEGVYGPILNVSDQANMQSCPSLFLSSNCISLSTSGPMIANAWEVYAQYSFNFSWTALLDGKAISFLQASFNLTDWQGDLCTPVPHDWLTCTETPLDPWGNPCIGITDICKQYHGFLFSTYSVTSLTLSNPTIDAFPIFMQKIKSANTIYGQNQSLMYLSEMSITNSTIQGQSFEFLISHFAGTQLAILDLSYNQIEFVPEASTWSGKSLLQSLNLSHNNLSGEFCSFSNLPFYKSLEKLDMSYNNFTSLPTEWENTTAGLVVLDVSHNELGGSISLLDELVEINAPTLQELYISDNNLTGEFSSSLYFSRLSMLEIAIFDRNRINGVLNLSAWQESMFEVVSMASSDTLNVTKPSKPLFSFLNNCISDITPSADALKDTIFKLRKDPEFSSNGGVLLGGNPYCKDVKSETQQYLCRFTVNDIVEEDHQHSNASLVGSICGGSIVALLSILSLAIIWRLRKKVQILRDFQIALGDADVKPQFYKYSDLKHATREFHKTNELGRGGFGVVHEGMLNGTAIAVKELFNSQNGQVLDDFLKEVVLITGIKHINLVQLKGCCIRDTQRLLVYECVENGNLAQCLWGSRSKHCVLSWEQRINICAGVASGLSYLHKHVQPSIIHRDIKPANILLDKNYEPKIADFGLARRFSKATQAHYTLDVAGTFGYLSPEYATQGQLSEKVDVYSYGIVVLEIISGRKCINHSFPEDAIFLKDWAINMQKKGTVLEILDPRLKDGCDMGEVLRTINVALLCVQTDPKKRPTMSQVLAMFLPSVDMKCVWDDVFQYNPSKVC